MASSASGTITPSPGGLVLTYLDTGSYGTIISRTLTVYNYNLAATYGPFSMGTNLSQAVDVTADGWLRFICIVVDNTGTFTATVDYLAEGQYIASFLNRMVSQGCGCDNTNQFCNLFKAQLNLVAAEWFSIPGLPIPAQSSITAANVYVNDYNPL